MEKVTTLEKDCTYIVGIDKDIEIVYKYTDGFGKARFESESDNFKREADGTFQFGQTPKEFIKFFNPIKKP